MKKFKTLIATGLVVVSMATTAVTALAYSSVTRENGGTWNSGINKNGSYYMAYSYYYHGTRRYYTTAGDANGKINKSITGLGTTCANGNSTKSPNKYVSYSFVY